MSTFPEVCPGCSGSGHVPDPNNPGNFIVCPQCGGTGVIQVTVD
jgi:DnaJ-class molecular chaperone